MSYLFWYTLSHFYPKRAFDRQTLYQISWKQHAPFWHLLEQPQAQETLSWNRHCLVLHLTFNFTLGLFVLCEDAFIVLFSFLHLSNGYLSHSCIFSTLFKKYILGFLQSICSFINALFFIIIGFISNTNRFYFGMLTMLFL